MYTRKGAYVGREGPDPPQELRDAVPAGAEPHEFPRDPGQGSERRWAERRKEHQPPTPQEPRVPWEG